MTYCMLLIVGDLSIYCVTMSQKHVTVVACITISNFVQDQSQCTETGFSTVENSSKPLFLKELKKIWDKEVPTLPWEKGDYTPSNTLLLDDSPYKALRNPVCLFLLSLIAVNDYFDPSFDSFHLVGHF